MNEIINQNSNIHEMIKKKLTSLKEQVDESEKN